MWSSDQYNYPSTEWQHVRVTVNFNFTSSNLAIIAQKRSKEGIIDIDDVKLSDSKCPKPVNCDFDDNWCGFTHNITTKKFWQLGFGRVINPKQLEFTNLISDHNPYTYYGTSIYTDFTFNDASSFKPSTMNLYSDIVPATPKTGACLTFYIFPRTIHLGSYFKINIQSIQNNQLQPLYMKDQVLSTSDFVQVKLDVIYDEPFRFSFETYSNNQSTYIQIDDVNYDQTSNCSQQGITTKNPTTKVIPTTPSPLSFAFDCDFEKSGICNWQQNLEKDHFGSSAQLVSKPLLFPTYDHTKQNTNGTYIYAFGTKYTTTDASIFNVAPINSYRGPICFTFWYFINTNSFETNFNVTFNFKLDTVKQFHRVDDQANKWNLGMIQHQIDDQNSKMPISIYVHAKAKDGIDKYIFKYIFKFRFN